jgi:hypothetical protein
MQQLYQRFTPCSPTVSRAVLQDAGEEQGVFLLGNEGDLAWRGVCNTGFKALR